MKLREYVARFKRWQWETMRPTMRRYGARLKRVAIQLPLPLGWAFLTWSMFLWSSRAWAASVGIYLLLTGFMPAIEIYFKARAEAKRSRIDR